MAINLNNKKNINEEVDLIKAKFGDEAEINKLISKNINYIYKLAHFYEKSLKNDFEDLVSEGIVGLLKALKNFDINKKNKFITYAYLYIKNQMYNYRNSAEFCVHLSNSQIRKYLRKNVANETVKSELLQKVNNCKKNRSIDVSDIKIKYHFEQDDEFDHINLKADIEEFLSSSNLNCREKHIIEKIYFEELKVNEIAYELNISEREVSRLKSSAIKKLRKQVNKLEYI